MFYSDNIANIQTDLKCISLIFNTEKSTLFDFYFLRNSKKQYVDGFQLGCKKSLFNFN